jgi:RHS repeat-associated protein
LVQVQDYRPAGGTAWDPNALPARRTDYLAGQPVEEYLTEAWQPEGCVWQVDLRPTQRYLSGLGVHAQQAVVPDPNNAGSNVPGYFGGETMHLHGDLIRSMLLRTDEGGQAVAVGGGPSAVLSYTAFGEPVWADPNGVVQVGFPPAGFGTRYQYAGGWGYETGLPSGDGGFRGGLAAGSPSRFVWDTTAAGPGELGRGPGTSQALGSPEGGWAEFAAGSGRPDEFRPPDDLLGLAGVNPTLPPLRLLHVGWRWYDPSLGRFVQRDPIGLGGGTNVYAYARCNGATQIDPLGLRIYRVLERVSTRTVVEPVYGEGESRLLGYRVITETMNVYGIYDDRAEAKRALRWFGRGVQVFGAGLMLAIGGPLGFCVAVWHTVLCKMCVDAAANLPPQRVGEDTEVQLSSTFVPVRQPLGGPMEP